MVDGLQVVPGPERGYLHQDLSALTFWRFDDKSVLWPVRISPQWLIPSILKTHMFLKEVTSLLLWVTFSTWKNVCSNLGPQRCLTCSLQLATVHIDS